MNQQLQITSPNVLRFTETQSLTHSALASNEVLVKVKRISLCGSDYSLFLGHYKGPKNYPIVIGHEWAGIVVDKGSAVINFDEGNNVTGDCSLWCGNCEYCKKDKNICQNIEKFGITVNGASQNEIVVNEKYLYRDHYDLSLSTLALTEMFAVAEQAIKKSVNFGTYKEKFAIFGAGAVGIAIYYLLTLYHSKYDVVIVESDSEKIKYIRSIFPEIAITTEEELNKNNSRYTFNRIFEASGSSSAFEYALEAIDPGGIVVVIGMSYQSLSNVQKAVYKGLTIVGSIGGTGSFEDVMYFFHRHHDTVKRFITHKYSLDKANLAFESGRHREKAIKVQLHINDQ